MQPDSIFRHRSHHNLGTGRGCVRFIRLFLLCWISSASAQTFHIEPANPILVGERLSIRIDGLPADENVTVTATRPLAAPDRHPPPTL